MDTPGVSVVSMDLSFKNAVNESVSDGLHQLFTDGELSDVTVTVGNDDFRCHRSILAAVSKFFRALFRNEAPSDHVTLDSDHVSPRSFALLLDMLYKKSDSVVNTDIATDMLISAVFLQIQFLQNHCEEYLVRTMTPDTCPDLWQFAELYNLEIILERGAKRMATSRFLEVSKSEAFDRLPLRFLLALLSSEDLVVTKEDHVADGIIKWVTADKGEREKYLPVLLPFVTFTNLSDGGIQSLRRPCSYINHIYGYLEEALTYKLEGVTKLNSVLRREILARQEKRLTDTEVDAAFAAFGHPDEVMKTKCPIFTCNMFPKNEAKVIYDDDDESIVEESEDEFVEPEEDEYESDSSEISFIVFDDVPGFGFATCVWRNELYISGGFDAPLSFKAYNAGTANWSQLPNLEQGRCGHAMVAVSKNIFLLGGVSGKVKESVQGMHDDKEENERLCEISVYSTEIQIWKTFARLPNPVTDVTAAVLGHRIYVLGGSDVAGQPMSLVQCVDTLTATVYRAGSLPSPSSGARALSDGAAIYVVVPEGNIYQMQENSFLAYQREKQLLVSQQSGDGAVLMTEETKHSLMQLTAITEDCRKRMAATRRRVPLRNDRETNVSCSDQTTLPQSSEEGESSSAEHDGETKKEETGDKRQDSSNENTAALLSVHPLTTDEDPLPSVSFKKLAVIPGRRQFGACLYKGELWVAGGQDAEGVSISDVIGVDLHTGTVTTKPKTLEMSRCNLHVINVPKLSDYAEYRFTFRPDDLVKDGDTVKSQLVKITKFDWYLSATRLNGDLGVYLYKSADFESRWVVSATWKIEILSAKLSAGQQQEEFSFTFKDSEGKGHGNEQFISMETLTDPANGYINKNGDVTVQATVTITEPPWQEPLPDLPPQLKRSTQTAGFTFKVGAPLFSTQTAGFTFTAGAPLFPFASTSVGAFTFGSNHV